MKNIVLNTMAVIISVAFNAAVSVAAPATICGVSIPEGGHHLEDAIPGTTVVGVINGFQTDPKVESVKTCALRGDQGATAVVAIMKDVNAGAYALIIGGNRHGSPSSGSVIIAQGYAYGWPGAGRAIDNLKEQCQDGTLNNVSCTSLRMMNSDIQENSVCAGVCSH